MLHHVQQLVNSCCDTLVNCYNDVSLSYYAIYVSRGMNACCIEHLVNTVSLLGKLTSYEL
jgi:hypothetical protein